MPIINSSERKEKERKLCTIWKELVMLALDQKEEWRRQRKTEN